MREIILLWNYDAGKQLQINYYVPDLLPIGSTLDPSGRVFRIESYHYRSFRRRPGMTICKVCASVLESQHYELRKELLDMGWEESELTTW